MTTRARVPRSRRTAGMLIALAMAGCMESSVTDPVVRQESVVGAPRCLGAVATIYPGHPGAGTIDEVLPGAYSLIEGTPGPDVIVGSSHRDFITAGAGDDKICSLDGPDLIRDGPGADRMDAGDGVDWILYDASTAGVRATINGAGHGGYAEGDRLQNFENMYGSIYDDVLRGDSGPNDIEAQSGNDVLFGYAGDDFLYGDTGNDVIRAGDGVDEIQAYDGDDMIYPEAGADVIRGGNGDDRVRYDTSPAGVTVTMGGTGSGGDADGDTYYDVESITGSNYDDVLTGNDLPNNLSGLGGNDVLNALGGNDRLDGGDGANALNGGTGRDTGNRVTCGDVLNAVEVVRTTCETVVDHFQIDILAPPGTIVEWTPFDVRITAKDASNNTVTSYVGITNPAYISHSLSSGLGTTPPFKAGVVDTFAAFVPSVSVYTIRAYNNFIERGSSVQFVPQFAAASPAQSAIFSNDASLPGDGATTTIIIVQLKEQYGHNLANGSGTVVLTTSAGTLTDGTNSGTTLTAINVSNGQAVLTLIAPATAGTATITGTLNGVPITSQATVTFTN